MKYIGKDFTIGMNLKEFYNRNALERVLLYKYIRKGFKIEIYSKKVLQKVYIRKGFYTGMHCKKDFLVILRPEWLVYLMNPPCDITNKCMSLRPQSIHTRALVDIKFTHRFVFWRHICVLGRG